VLRARYADCQILAQQDLVGQGCFLDPLGVLDVLGAGLAVTLIHSLKNPASLPERTRDDPGAQTAVQEETEP
jgi:hypothetical protein